MNSYEASVKPRFKGNSANAFRHNTDCFFMNRDFSIYLFRIPQILKVTETTASTRLASALLHLSVGFSRNHT